MGILATFDNTFIPNIAGNRDVKTSELNQRGKDAEGNDIESAAHSLKEIATSPFKIAYTDVQVE